MVQAAHTAVANGRGTIEQRLARWLLMVHDRLTGNELPLTHEFIALMLNVRRAGVTEALQGLDRTGLVSAKRGRIVVNDRAGLLARANGLYGIPESEYLRLTGWKTKH
jgi:CRP-like cAMP-binding protein